MDLFQLASKSECLESYLDLFAIRNGRKRFVALPARNLVGCCGPKATVRIDNTTTDEVQFLDAFDTYMLVGNLDQLGHELEIVHRVGVGRMRCQWQLVARVLVVRLVCGLLFELEWRYGVQRCRY